MKKITVLLMVCIMLLSGGLSFVCSAAMSQTGEDLSSYVKKIDELDENTKKDFYTALLTYYYWFKKDSLDAYACNGGGKRYKNCDEFVELNLNSYMSGDKSDGSLYNGRFCVWGELYGPFDGGTYVFMMSYSMLLNADMGGGTLIGEHWFPTGGSSSIHYFVWKNGTIKTAERAYNRDALSKDAEETLAKIIKKAKKCDEEQLKAYDAQKYDPDRMYCGEHYNEIAESYIGLFKAKNKTKDLSDLTIDNVTADKIYTLDGDAYLIYMYCDKEEPSDDPGIQVAGGYEFKTKYKNVKYLVWQNGKLHSLSYAMDNGLIDDYTLRYFLNYAKARKLSEQELSAAKLTETTEDESLFTGTSAPVSERVTQTSATDTVAASMPANTTATGAGASSAPSSQTTSPKTGDSNVLLILVISAAALMTVFFVRKIREK